MPIAGAGRTPQPEPFQGLLERLARNPARTVPMIGARRRQLAGDAATVATATDLAAAAPRGPRPWLSASASLLVWGAGQWLNRDRSLALLFCLLQALAIAWAWCLSATWDVWVRLGWLFFIDEITLRTAAAVAGLAIPALAILSVAQAYLRAERHPGARPFEGPAALPALASALVPGWGQILNGQIGKTVLFLASWAFGLYVFAASQIQPRMWAWIDPTEIRVAGVRVTAASLAALAVATLGWVLAAYDAALTARTRIGAARN